MKTGQSLDYEQGSFYYVEVAATDEPKDGTVFTNPSTSEPKSFNIQVLNVNEAPSFLITAAPTTVTESMDAGDTVLILGSKFADDADFPNKDSNGDVYERLTLQISEHNYLCAGMTAPPKSNANEDCCLDAEAFTVTQEVTDQNKGILMFKSDAGTNVLNGKDGCTLELKITATDEGKHGREGVDGAEGADDPPNRLTSANFLTVTMEVAGSNEPPKIEDQEFGDLDVTCLSTMPNTCINENTKDGTPIINGLVASDEDIEKSSQELRYIISQQKQTFDVFTIDRFSIDEVTGHISVTALGESNLDYESEDTYVITVAVWDVDPAEDPADPHKSLFDEAKITIKLSNVNEPPAFNAIDILQSTEYVSYRDDSYVLADGKDVVGVVSASDEDVADAGQLTYSIPSDDSFPFELVAGDVDPTGQSTAKFRLKANRELNYEDRISYEGGFPDGELSNEPYVVDVTVTDTATPTPNTAVQQVKIYVKDVNERPTWEDKSYYDVEEIENIRLAKESFEFVLPESISAGVLVGNVKVKDVENNTMHYEFIEFDGDQSMVAAGQVSTAK